MTAMLLLTATLFAADPIDIGSRRELFVDHHLIDKLDGAHLELARPHDEGMVMPFDQPWEGSFCGYCTVIADGPLYRCYYRGWPSVDAPPREGEVTCYAESKDGTHWTKPNLGLVSYNGSTKNNIILDDKTVTHNFSPFLDTRPGVPAEERYKALGGKHPRGLTALCSADGIHWKRFRPEPVIVLPPKPYGLDSQNVGLWSPIEKCYVCYLRIFHDKIRRIARCTSQDFATWTKPQLMEYRTADGSPAPVEHHYTSQTHPYMRAPHIYVALAARFMPGRQVLTPEQAQEAGVIAKYYRDTSDGIFMTSRGGQTYDRTFLEGFIRPGVGPQNWVSRTNYPALNVVPTGPAEMSVFVNQNYAQPTAHLRRYSLRLDGLALLQAGAAGGSLVTKPITFQGGKMYLNFATSAAGEVRVELRSPDGSPLTGFSEGDCQPVIGNEIERAVVWKGNPDLSKLAGQPVRLVLHLKDADVFAFRFGD